MKNKKMVLMMVLVAIIAGSISFYAGVKHGEASSTPSMANAQGQFRGGNRTLRMGGGFTGGTVISKDATSLTIQARDGSSKIVFFTAGTPVMKMVAGTAADIIVGKDVSITGKTNPDGSLSADSISLRTSMAQNPDPKVTTGN